MTPERAAELAAIPQSLVADADDAGDRLVGMANHLLGRERSR